jgi:mannose-1-phosphate guanylyltransferase
MKAIVLIGGFGTRLRPLTYTIPKQLIPIAGKPMLYHVLDLLPPDLEEVVLSTGYKAEEIQRFVTAHPPRWPVKFVAETEPLGTGGGTKNASDGISDPFLQVNSDVIAQFDVQQLLELHRSRGGIGAMTLAEVADTRPYGVAALDGDSRITQFVEKPAPEVAPSHWINAGLSVWKREVLEVIPSGRQVSFETEVIPVILDRGIYGFQSRGFWEDAGTPERLLHAQRLLFDGGRGGKGVLPHGAMGKGPVAASAGVVAERATFGPYVHLGERVRVEPGAHVEDSVLMDDVVVEKEASVRGSILGPRVRVAAGTRVQGQVLAG